MPHLIDFPHDVLLVLLETVAKQAPTSLIPLTTSSKLFWNLYSRPHTKLVLTREIVKSHLAAYYGVAKIIVILEGFGFHLAAARKQEKELAKRPNENEVGKEVEGDQCSKGQEDASKPEDAHDEDELIFRKHELQLLHAIFTLHQTILAITGMLVDERDRDPLCCDEGEENEYVEDDMSFAIDDLFPFAYLDRAKVWNDNESGHCKGELSKLEENDEYYFDSIQEECPVAADLYRTGWGVDQWGLLAERYQIDFQSAARNGVLAELEAREKVDLEHLEWVSIQCFTVAEHYKYLKSKDLRERLTMLATHCAHETSLN